MRISRIRNGAILISVGLVLLLNNLDYVDWSVWFSILSLWPVLLIAIGIEKLFAKTALSFLALLSPVLLLIAILGPAYFYLTQAEEPDFSRNTYNWEKKLELPYKKGYASIDYKAGRLEINSSPDKLITAELDYWRRKPISVYNYSEPDSIVRLNLKDIDRFWKTGFKSSFKKSRDWNISLSDKIPWELEIESAAMSGDFDLSELNLENLSIELDASSFKLKLGDKAKSLKASIDTDVSKLELLLPKSAGLQIENRASLSSTEFSNISLNRERKRIWTHNYDTAPFKIEIHLKGAISRLKIVGY
jgi:hypothetical protein